jgi:hypothetical protein
MTPLEIAQAVVLLEPILLDIMKFVKSLFTSGTEKKETVMQMAENNYKIVQEKKPELFAASWEEVKPEVDNKIEELYQTHIKDGLHDEDHKN